MKAIYIPTLILFCGFFLANKAQADVCSTPDNLVTNCGFETGDLTGWLQEPPNEAGNWYGVDSYDAYTGTYGAYLAGYGSFANGDVNYALIGQDVTTVVGKEYVFSYDWAHNTSADPTAVPDDYFAAGLNGYLVASSQQVDVGNQPFTDYSYTFFATSTTTLIEFEAEDANFYFSIDDVSLAPAPEPASFAFVAPVLAGLFLFSISATRRSRARKVRSISGSLE